MNFEKYVNKFEYPVSPKKPKVNITGSVINSDQAKDMILKCKQIEEEVAVYEKSIIEYHKKKEEYYKIQNELDDQFKLDAFEELGISDDPCREHLFSKAWNDGHSDGISSVFYKLQDLTDWYIKCIDTLKNNIEKYLVSNKICNSSVLSCIKEALVLDINKRKLFSISSENEPVNDKV